MAREITQREPRNDGSDVVRADAGESFAATRNGMPVGELTPAGRRRFVTADALVEAFREAAPVDHDRFGADVDDPVDKDPTPPL